MRHPAQEIGSSRICPVTGTVFEHCWSERGFYDSCDQCKPASLTTSERLAALNSKRQRESEQEK